MAAVRVGIIGIQGSSLSWIDAVAADPRATLVAVSDHDTEAAEPAALRHRAQFEPDDRALLIQHAPDLVILATSPHTNERLLPLVVERRLAAIVEPPAARSLDVARSWAEQFESAGRPLWVASDWRFDPAALICGHAAELLGEVIHAAVTLLAPLPAPLRWQADRVRGGGGVLGGGAYQWLDALVAACGTPADVLAVLGRVGRSTTEPYDTEDTASLLLRYEGGGSATVMARWGPPPYESRLYLSGRNRAASMSTDAVVIHPAMHADPLDEPFLERAAAAASTVPSVSLAEPELRQRSTAGPRAMALSRALKQALDPAVEAPPVDSQLRHHLPTLAVLQAAYLSARTGEPEAVA